MGNRITTYITKILPSWINNQFMLALSGQADQLVDYYLQVKKQAFILSQDGGMLDLSARNSGDRRLQYRFPTPESDDQLKAYLLTRWTRHLEAGTQDALDFQVRRFGFTNYTWVTEQGLRDAGYVGAFGNDADGLQPGTLPTDPPLVPGPGSNYFAIIIRPPHYFTPAEKWDVTTKKWDDPDIWWDLGKPYGYPVDPNTVLNDFAELISDWRQSGASLRHVVIDFVGDCVVDNATASGYSGTNYAVWGHWETTERRADGTYLENYNFSWKVK